MKTFSKILNPILVISLITVSIFTLVILNDHEIMSYSEAHYELNKEAIVTSTGSSIDIYFHSNTPSIKALDAIVTISHIYEGVYIYTPNYESHTKIYDDGNNSN